MKSGCKLHLDLAFVIGNAGATILLRIFFFQSQRPFGAQSLWFWKRTTHGSLSNLSSPSSSSPLYAFQPLITMRGNPLSHTSSPGTDRVQGSIHVALPESRHTRMEEQGAVIDAMTSKQQLPCYAILHVFILLDLNRLLCVRNFVPDNSTSSNFSSNKCASVCSLTYVVVGDILRN